MTAQSPSALLKSIESASFRALEVPEKHLSLLCRPFGFLEAFDPNYTPNTTDEASMRYTFRNQPEIGQWNLAQLANAMLIADLFEQVGVKALKKPYSLSREPFPCQPGNPGAELCCGEDHTSCSKHVQWKSKLLNFRGMLNDAVWTKRC